MTYDPFNTQIEPLNPEDRQLLFPLALRRSVMWDFVGKKLLDDPEKFGEQQASKDVLESEYRDMERRRLVLLPFDTIIDDTCKVAADAATTAVIAVEPNLKNLTEEEAGEFLAENTRISTAVTKTVIAHLITHGVLRNGMPI